MSKYKDVFIEKSQLKHNNLYDYSLVKDDINCRSLVDIICHIHGVFSMEARVHSSNGVGCRECMKNKIINNNRKNKEHFIKKANILHAGKYDYSKVDYIDAKHKVIIICSIHGEFLQTSSNHYSYGCPQCGKISIGNKLRKSTEQFIIDANKIHNYKYDYSKVIYIDAITNVDIICPKHGVFSQKPNKHLSNHGCIYCRESRGERKIDIYLNNKQILFNRQKRFIDCVDKLTLPFDFYLPEYNLCIEFDGRQHFEPVFDFNNGNWFELTKKHDKIKNEYCENKNIKLLRVSYKDDI
jgi:predicted RNA-binding Zn-ribbon protein involved in translation (DUF1610 family)/very-short-patch-repair endonuclease